ncbi:MAG: ribbon-helix-helix domain-containing protein [Nitrospinota bacterium]
MERNTFKAQQKREMISRTFHLDSRQLEPLKKVSRELGISQSEMIRRSVALFIDEFKKHSKKNR